MRLTGGDLRFRYSLAKSDFSQIMPLTSHLLRASMAVWMEFMATGTKYGEL